MRKLKILRQCRLVCAYLHFLAAVMRLVAVLVDMASFYVASDGTKVGSQVRA